MADLHPEVLKMIEEYVAGPPHGEFRQKAAMRRIAALAAEKDRESWDELMQKCGSFAEVVAKVAQRRGKP